MPTIRGAWEHLRRILGLGEPASDPGALVTIQPGELRIVGVAMEGGGIMSRGQMRVNIRPSFTEQFPSWGYQASSAYRNGAVARGADTRYQYTGFSEEVEKRAWELLKKYMTPEQHFAFMEGTAIELENLKGDYRLLIEKSGDFKILMGPRGGGVIQTSGTIRSYKYPLGDEIAAFLDWFNHRTEELITNWHCGTFGIKKEGEI